jgi:serine protease Do
MKLTIATGVLACAAAWGQPAPPAPPTPPARPAQAVRQRIITSGAPTSYLGIGVQDVDAERAKALNLKEEHGAEVMRVESGSPAEKAGFKEHDVVLEFNGQTIQGKAQLARMVQETPADRQVKISVWRNGKNENLTATVATRNESGLTMFGFDSDSMKLPEKLGNLRDLYIDTPNIVMSWKNRTLGIMGESMGQQAQFADFLGVKDGVLVKEVTKGSAAEKAGIKAGDVVTKVDDAAVKSTNEISNKLRALTKNTFTVTVVRAKKELPLTVTIENPARTRGEVLAFGSSRV